MFYYKGPAGQAHEKKVGISVSGMLFQNCTRLKSLLPPTPKYRTISLRSRKREENTRRWTIPSIYGQVLCGEET